MKKLLKSLLVLIVVFLFTSCVGLETKQEVSPSNIFTDSKSGTILKIVDDFEYKGQLDFTKNNLKPSNSDGAMKLISNYHIWAKDNGSYILVLFQTLKDEHAYYHPVIPTKKWKGFRIKKEKLGGDKWVSLLYNVRANKWWKNKLTELGIDVNMNEQFIFKQWIRNSRIQTRINIFYYEKSSINTNELKAKSYMSDLERVSIEEFEKRADAVITFIK